MMHGYKGFRKPRCHFLNFQALMMFGPNDLIPLFSFYHVWL